MAGDWDFGSVVQSLEAQEPKPVYVLHGEETFLIDELTKHLSSRVLLDSPADFNCDSFYAGQVDVGRICDAAETLPMMGVRRFVLVKDAQNFREDDTEQLLRILETPIPSTVLTLVFSRLDKRKRLYKILSAKSVMVDCKRPSEYEIPQWIASLGSRYGLALTPPQIKLIHEMVGSSLQDLAGEINKLSQFVNGRSEVSNEEIEQAISRLRQDSVFELTDAIGKNDRVHALICLANLLDQGQNEIGALALISRHIRILRGVHEGIEQGLSGSRLATQVGVAPYFLKGYVSQSRQWTKPKLEKAYQALVETDRALKSSPISGPIWLENFILRVCAKS